MDREKAVAEATPLPSTNDTDIERPAPPSTQPSRRYVPKLLPRFTRGRRPTSQPGKSRSVDEKHLAEQSAAPTPRTEGPAATPTDSITTPATPIPTEEKSKSAPAPVEGQEEVKLDGGDIPRIVTPTEFNETEYVQRSKSDRGTLRLDIVSQSAPAATAQPHLTGHDPVSSVPARLLPGGAPAPDAGAAPPSNANLLSEALLLERGRRRLAAQQGIPAGAIRIPSTGGIPRSGAPSRQPTPPSGTSGPAPHLASLPVGSATVPSPTPGQVLSPMPMPARRGTKFKSVPTPIGTPRIGGPEENPMEMVKLPEQKE